MRGQVMNAGNLQPLVGANVYWEGKEQQGTLTDLDGNFSIPATALPAKIILSYLGYEKSIRTIQVRDLEKVQRFYLKAEDFSLEEVLIQEKRGDEQVKNLELGKSTLSMETLQSLPALFGEVDLLRSLQLLPGVKSAGEGTTGLFVRGGSADQNLVQVDGAPVYNASHFFGIFSVFNPDGIKKVDLYKGNMPASVGGRASSLIDVTLREGEKDRIQGEGGIGTISSRMTLQGPLLGKKSSQYKELYKMAVDYGFDKKFVEDRLKAIEKHELANKAIEKDVSDEKNISNSKKTKSESTSYIIYLSLSIVLLIILYFLFKKFKK